MSRSSGFLETLEVWILCINLCFSNVDKLSSMVMCASADTAVTVCDWAVVMRLLLWDLHVAVLVALPHTGKQVVQGHLLRW